MHAIHGAVLRGINAIPITVEVQLMRRLPSITVVGYAHHVRYEKARNASVRRLRPPVSAFPPKRWL